MLPAALVWPKWRTSALSPRRLEDEAVNAVVVLLMCSSWTTCKGLRIIPLPTQDCACHRIEFIDALVDGHQDGSARSVVVTELASSKLLQIKVQNLLHYQYRDEEITTDERGFEVRRYTARKDVVGAAV